MATLNPPQGSGYGAAAAPARQPENVQPDRRNAFTDAPLVARHAGIGLPCAKCKTYYAADLTACPVYRVRRGFFLVKDHRFDSVETCLGAI